MFGWAAVVAVAIALILRLASIAKGTFLTWETFALIGLLLLILHLVTGWWPNRHGT